MGKIGLLTYHHTTNFGSLLQTYSLFKAVTEKGMECEIIDYHNAAVDKRETPLRLWECKSPKALFRYVFRQSKKRQKEKYFNEFVAQKMALSTTKYISENIAAVNTEYDTLLIGSDLVWDFSINGHDTTYMLDFADEKTRKIAYASSAGSVWDEREEVTNLLKRFNHIGVREYAIKECLEQWLNQGVDFVCDPTMLIPQEEWKKLIKQRPIKDKYVLCYMNDQNNTIYKDAIKYAKDNGTAVYVLAYGKPPKGTKAISPVTIEEFLSLIYYADAVFTASYHGMLFSLYFEKEFFYYNRGWKSRMESIATYLNILDREGLSNQNEDRKMNYNDINLRIEMFRKDSLKTLFSYFTD